MFCMGMVSVTKRFNVGFSSFLGSPKSEDVPCDMTVGRMRMQFDNASQQPTEEIQESSMNVDETSQGKEIILFVEIMNLSLRVIGFLIFRGIFFFRRTSSSKSSYYCIRR